MAVIKWIIGNGVDNQSALNPQMNPQRIRTGLRCANNGSFRELCHLISRRFSADNPAKNPAENPAENPVDLGSLGTLLWKKHPDFPNNQ